MADPRRNLMTDYPLCNRISDKMDFIYRYKPGNNIKFLVGNESHDFYAVFSASEFVLSASSLEFEERTSPDKDDICRYIVIQEYDPRVFRKVIRFMYTDKIKFADPLDFVQIFTIANEYSILSLIDVCENYMQEPTIHGENAVSWLKAGMIVKSSFLKLLSITFIESNPEDVLNQQNFRMIEIEHLCRIMRTMKLQLPSEVTLLKALCKWVTFNNGTDGFEHKTLKELMYENLRFIHFQSLTAQEFDTVLADYTDSFRQSDIIDIFCVIAEPDLGNYMQWMRRTKPREIRMEFMRVDCAGPIYNIPSKKFLIPIEEIKYPVELNYMETALKVVAKKPLTLVGLALLCPNTTEQEKATIRWKSRTFGFYNNISNEMSCTDSFKVENNHIRIPFPKQFSMNASLVFIIKIKVKYESTKAMELPVRVAEPSKGAVFVPYGRCPYYEGDFIVKELHYI